MLALLPASAAANTVTEIIVKRDPGVSGAELRDIRADADVHFVETLPLPRTEVVAARPGDVTDALRDLNADPDVVYAEPNRPIHAADVETDLWGLEKLRLLEPDGGPDLGWDLSTGLRRTVAVVDSGVDDSHPDLDNRVVPGYDFVDEDADADDEDVDGHGTHVAGTIAAERDGEGVAGVAHEARILPLRVLDAEGSGAVGDFIEAIHFAAERGVRIVNASLSGVGPLNSERAAIAAHPEVLFVVAAGNSGIDNDTSAEAAEYPCSYDLANVLCVGASDESDNPADFSNHGSTTVDVFAPGVEIESTIPLSLDADGLDTKDGTSMATPHVAGTAALILSQTPELSPEDVIDAVVGTADKTNLALDGESVSDGRADAYAALTGNDADGDAVPDGDDNCPVEPNPGQADSNADGIGDACAPPDDDRDGDGVLNNGDDECPDEPAPYDEDGCPGVGPDTDGDTVLDVFDNCPGSANGTQIDSDSDDTGDACDDTPRGGDADGDGVAALDDNCRTTPNPTQGNTDGDAAGDACDGDLDGDGWANGGDSCATLYNPSQANADADVFGDACDSTPRGHDADGDGKPSADDSCPTVFGTLANGCPAPVAAQVTSVAAKVRKRGTRRSAKLTISTTAAATVRITVERKSGRRWVRVTRKTLATSGNRAVLTVSRLKRGAHRARISISSGAGRGTPVTKAFRVR